MDQSSAVRVYKDNGEHYDTLIITPKSPERERFYISSRNERLCITADEMRTLANKMLEHLGIGEE